MGRIYGMKNSWKGHKDRNRHKNKIKRSGQARLVYVFNINHNILTMWRWANEDLCTKNIYTLRSNTVIVISREWRKLVVKSSVVPQQPSQLRDRWWWWWSREMWMGLEVRHKSKWGQCTVVYFVVQGQDSAVSIECGVHYWKVMRLVPGRSRGRLFSPRVNFVHADAYPMSVPPLCYSGVVETNPWP